jgi:hypothetical protein
MSPIVGIPLHNVSHAIEDTLYGSKVASQFVGNHLYWFGTLATQESPKESFCGALIPMRLNQNIEYDAVLIHATDTAGGR